MQMVSQTQRHYSFLSDYSEDENVVDYYVEFVNVDFAVFVDGDVDVDCDDEDDDDDDDVGRFVDYYEVCDAVAHTSLLYKHGLDDEMYY
jgi:hypothetical protein